MKVSLIITTYNRPNYLRCTLQSVLGQSVMPDEVIIADDGSEIATRELVEKFRPCFGKGLKYVWQPDEGFRLSRIRNKGIEAAESDYIIFIDGDVILHKDFVKEHIDNSCEGCFVSGLRAYINESETRRLIGGGKAVRYAWYCWSLSHKLHAYHNRWLTKIFLRHHKDSVSQLMGSNIGFWKRDALRINGFDERFVSWGAEDRDFAARLLKIGVKRRYMIFSGIQYHLNH